MVEHRAHEGTARPPAAIKERVNGLELCMRDGDLHERLQVIACNESQHVGHRCRHTIMVWRHELRPVRMAPVTATDPHLFSPIPASQRGVVSEDRRLHFGPILVYALNLNKEAV